jgi:hypothetical protein
MRSHSSCPVSDTLRSALTNGRTACTGDCPQRVVPGLFPREWTCMGPSLPGLYKPVCGPIYVRTYVSIRGSPQFCSRHRDLHPNADGRSTIPRVPDPSGKRSLRGTTRDPVPFQERGVPTRVPFAAVNARWMGHPVAKLPARRLSMAPLSMRWTLYRDLSMACRLPVFGDAVTMYIACRCHDRTMYIAWWWNGYTVLKPFMDYGIVLTKLCDSLLGRFQTLIWRRGVVKGLRKGIPCGRP